MKYIERIMEKLKEKEAVEQKFHRLDTHIIATLTVKDFFEHLISGMIEIFDVPYIWLTAIEESRLAELVKKGEQSLTLRARAGFIARDEYISLLPVQKSPVHISDPGAFCSLFPEDGIYPVKSMAACPVQIDGETVGSLNFGDISPGRFNSAAETEMLSGILLKISLCLSNVAAHEELDIIARRDSGSVHAGRLYPIKSGRQQNTAKQTA